MKTTKPLVLFLLFFTGLFIFSGCSKSNNSLDSFQPEINNITDNFQLQATKVDNVSTTLYYNWNNSGTQGNVDKSGAISSGNARLTIYDAGNTQVYNSDLKITGSEPTMSGIPGTWKIKVELTSIMGDLNFRVQKGG